MSVNLKRQLCALTAVFTILPTATTLAYATPTAHADVVHAEAFSKVVEDDAVKTAINRLDPYVVYRQDEIVLDAPKSVIGSISPDIFAQISAGLKGINQQIKEGKVSIAAIRAGQFQSRDAGENSITAHWWGYNIKLSNDVFSRISKASYGVAGTAAVLAEMSAAGVITLPASIPIGTIAVVIGSVTAILEPCNWNGRGIQLRYMFVGVNHCWPQ